MKLLSAAIIMSFSVVSTSFSAEHAPAGLQSSRPMGFFGDGHAENHEHYNGLINAKNGSCCNGKDGRPTSARWNELLQTWDFMVDGKWRTLPPDEAYKVLTPEVFAAQHRERWDRSAHVFTNESGTTIWCFIPPAPDG